tara:strand:+ start:3947 stop:4114 length:168 start_codon:yes stop_codon:yes gene_type:complete
MNEEEKNYIFFQYLEDKWTKEVQKAQKIKEVLRQKKESALDTAYRVGHGVADDSE